MMIECVTGAACDLPQPTFKIVLESFGQCHIGDVAAGHAYEVMMMTECELGEFVPRGVLLHARNTINDTRGDEHGEVPVQRALDEATARLQQFAHCERPGCGNEFADDRPTQSRIALIVTAQSLGDFAVQRLCTRLHPITLPRNENVQEWGESGRRVRANSCR